MKVSNEGLDLNVVFRRYQTGNIAIVLFTEDKRPWCNATINVEGLSASEVAVKNYPEMHGMYNDLLEAGIVKPAHRGIGSGRSGLRECELTQEAMAEAFIV